MSDPTSGPGEASEAFWRDFLVNGDPNERRNRRIFQRLPSAPRCKACAAPFSGLGGQAMRLIGKRKSAANPNLCNSCFDFMTAHRGGAEIEITMLFADIRGSTAIAERLTPGAFRDLIDRFYRVATDAVFSHGGGVDKFVGDEVVAMFLPLVNEDHHASAAVAAAEALMASTGHHDSAGPWIPVGAGIHTGTAWVGAVGDASHVELTALGDAVNVAARLASAAAAGEILVSAEGARRAGLPADLPRSTIELKGKSQPVEVIRIIAAARRSTPAGE